MKRLISILLLMFAMDAWATESHYPDKTGEDSSAKVLDLLKVEAERLYPASPHEQWYFIMVELESLKSADDIGSSNRY